MKQVLLNEEEHEKYQAFLLESLVSQQLDKVFKRLANYIGITEEELIQNYGAGIYRNSVYSNGYICKGRISTDVIDEIRNLKDNNGKELSKFDTFTKLMNTWGYQINGVEDDEIHFRPLYNVKYEDNKVNKMYKDMVKLAAEDGRFFHISMIPPEKLGDLRPKGGDYRFDFETHENAVYMINSALGNMLTGDGDGFEEFSDVINMGIMLACDHYGRYPNRYENYIEEMDVPYSEEYKEYRRNYGDLEDDDESEIKEVLPIYIYELDIGKEFLKERPWKLYFDASAGGGACYVKHTIKHDKIKLVKKFYYVTDVEGGKFVRGLD